MGDVLLCVSVDIYMYIYICLNSYLIPKEHPLLTVHHCVEIIVVTSMF